MNWLEVALGLTAGLSLFLFGVGQLSDALRELAGDRVRSLLKRATRNRFAAVGTGAVASTVLDSSSATIIILIALIDAGLLGFANALGVILGANIGTTVSSQLFALDIMQFAPFALAVGFLLRLSGSERVRVTGNALFAFGLVFFGLHIMETATLPIREEPGFLDLMRKLENPWLGVLAGALFTAVIQSSSATLGIVIVLAGQGAITLPAGLAVMLGAEIGTCTDTLLASVGRSREAARAGLFQLCFNVSTVLLGIVCLPLLHRFAEWSAPGAINHQIANTHVLFNVAGVALFIAGTPQIAALLTQILPDRNVDSAAGQQLRALSAAANRNPHG